MAIGTRNASVQRKNRIVIIGAGPAGLCALKCVLGREEHKNGEWEVVVFEAREDVGGVWLPAEPISPSSPPPTPLYDSLTTNLPHPLMSFPNFPFPPETALFPKAAAVLKYLQLYARFHCLHSYIQLGTRVVNVDWNIDERRWVVETKEVKEEGGKGEVTYADLVMICDGHYASPRFPSTPGVQKWIENGLATHSMWYRHPPPPLGSLTSSPGSRREIKVLIVGAGPSGQDLVADFLSLSPSASYSYTVIHSTTASPSESIPQANGNLLLRRPRVSLYHPLQGDAKPAVAFQDGEGIEGIDHVYLATGYSYSYPFLPTHILQPGYPPALPSIGSQKEGGLWNTSYSVHHLARHIWPTPAGSSAHSLPYPPTSLTFLALPSRVSPLPLVEAQASACLAAFAEPSLLDLEREKRIIEERWDEATKGGGKEERDTWGRWHVFQEGSEQYDYREILSADFKMSPAHTVPTWHREVYEEKGPLRSAWQALEREGEWEEYVKGVGCSGWDEVQGGYENESCAKEAEREWESVCWRVLEWRRGNGEKARRDHGAEESNSVDLGKV